MTIAISSLPSSIRPTFAVLNDRLYIATGDSRIRVVENNGTTVTSRNSGILAPTSAPVAAISGTGSLLGTYAWTYSFYNKNSGWESDPSPLASISSVASQGVLLSSFPSTYPDDQATSIRIYRSKTEGATYYYDTQIEEGTTSYLDVLSDQTLGTDTVSYTNGVPPAVKYILAHQRRLWFAGVDAYTTGTVTLASVGGTTSVLTVTGTGTNWPEGLRARFFQVNGDPKIYTIQSWDSATQLTLANSFEGTLSTGLSYYITGNPDYVWYSEIGADDTPQPEYVPMELDVANYVDMTSSDGDFISGLAKTRSNTLLVFKAHQTWALAGNTAATFSKNLVNPFGGCCSHWTIANDDKGNVIYLDGESGVFQTDGINFVSLSAGKIDDLLKYYTNTNYKHVSHAIYYPKRSWYMLFVNSLWSSTTPDMCLIYDFKSQEWFPRDISAVCSGLVWNETTKELEAWIGDESGFLHRLDQDGVYANSVASGTTGGTITSCSATAIADTSATFNTTGDGNKGCFVTIVSGTGAGQKRLISSNTSSLMTVSTNFVVTPVVGESVYRIGAISAIYRSKWLDLSQPETYKKFYTFFMTYMNQSSSTNLTVKFFTDFSTEDGTVTVTNGSPNVTGSGTLFDSSMKGMPITFSNDASEYIISNVTSQTAIVLNRAFMGATSTGNRYLIERSSSTVDLSDGVDKIIDMALRARYVQIRISMQDTNKRFQLNSIGYNLDANSDVGL